MDAPTDGDKWPQLLEQLGAAAMLHHAEHYDGRRAAIAQLNAVVNFLCQAVPNCPIDPLIRLSNALQDIERGSEPPMLKPQPVKGRPPDDVDWVGVKIISATIMDQLHEYAEMSRPEAAKAVAKKFAELGLSTFRGRNISATAITKWRDEAKTAAGNSKLGRFYKHSRLIDAKPLARRDVPPEHKRDFLLHRLSAFLISFGAQGQKAEGTRQRLISEIYLSFGVQF
jgi:hypothetical protein